ncbi:MAG: HAMP domain-containing sensor histidine kinase [Candidatus Omnitrophota bacterium]|nr:HAMP domain-containing sensor histidine kinase [Candidatus Omnitrophota bacterium]
MNKKGEAKEAGYGLVLQELQENPYRKFNLAFSLMVILPFLVFLYILVSKLFTLNILIGNIGIVLLIALFISICGFLIGVRILKNILKKLIALAAQAKHSDQLKSTFVATVSHELKNPLTSIKTNIYNISAGFTGEVNLEQKNILGLCQDTIDRMSRLVNDLLDLHKIEAGMTDVNRKPCNVIELSEKQIRELGVVAGARNIQIVKEFSDTKLTVWADEDKLARVINNLLSNAIKFTPEAGIVTLKVYPADNFARIECIDTGTGIEADNLEKIFSKFERLNSVKEGTGLGLAISKDIAEMHRGKILVESEIGKGSKFILLLPRDLRGRGR